MIGVMHRELQNNRVQGSGFRGRGSVFVLIFLFSSLCLHANQALYHYGMRVCGPCAQITAEFESGSRRTTAYSGPDGRSPHACIKTPAIRYLPVMHTEPCLRNDACAHEELRRLLVACLELAEARAQNARCNYASCTVHMGGEP